jgi:hypothetical protein
MLKWNVSVTFFNLFANYNIFFYLFSLNPIKFKLITDKKLAEKAFSSIIMPNKTSKQTGFNRFKELDNIILESLKHFDKYKILDVGISNGITTCELRDMLISNKKKFSLYATDKYPNIFYVKNHFFTAFLDNQYNVKSIYSGFFYLSDYLSWKYFISKILFKLLRHSIRVEKNKTLKINLFYSEFEQLINSNDIKFFEHDIIEPFPQTSFEFVRIMNLLNLNYFSKEFIKIALNNIKLAMKDNGILLIGRTINGSNHASLYKFKESKFVLLHKVNSGSEIHNLIVV